MSISEPLEAIFQIPLLIATRLGAFKNISFGWGSKLSQKALRSRQFTYLLKCVLAGALFVLADPHAKGF